MKVTIDIENYPDLIQAAKEILSLWDRKENDVDFEMFDSAISALELAKRECKPKTDLKLWLSQFIYLGSASCTCSSRRLLLCPTSFFIQKHSGMGYK